MVNQVANVSGGAHSTHSTSSGGVMPAVYSQIGHLSGEGGDHFESSQHGHHQPSGGIISRFFGKIRQILSDVVALPGVIWKKLFGGHDDGHHGPNQVKILEDRGLLSGNMMDGNIPEPHGDNIFLARRGTLSSEQNYS